MPLLEIKDEAISGVRKAVSLDSQLTCAEYFAGIGLIRLGLEKAGWKIIFANDWAYSKFEMYKDYNSYQNTLTVRCTDGFVRVSRRPKSEKMVLLGA